MNDELDKIMKVYEDSIIQPRIDEINKAKFDREIEKAKTNKARLSKLKKTIAAMGDMLPKKDTEYLLGKIKSYLGEENINEASIAREGKNPKEAIQAIYDNINALRKSQGYKENSEWIGPFLGNMEKNLKALLYFIGLIKRGKHDPKRMFPS